MAQQGRWSSLPADLVNRVADCLLATNDLDCYTDLRAVCHHWRSSTADPVSNQHEPRFRPSRWIMLDGGQHKASSATATTLLFVNTATGRFLRRRLPLLQDQDQEQDYCYVLVTSTTDGLLVLAGRDPPYAVSVLNPFTGSLVRFAAPLPIESQSQSRLPADAVGSSPTLVLVSVARSRVYWAEPQSESFRVVKASHRRDCPASRLPQIAAAIINNRESVPGTAMSIFDYQLRSEEADDGGCRRCYAVVAGGGDMLAVLKRRRGMDVFKIDAAGNVMERVKSIGSQALFLGVRCIVLDTDCFPTVEANCAYFQLADNRYLGQRYIYKLNIATCDDDQEPAFVSAAMGGATVYLPWLCNLRPFTLTQFLSNYTMDIPCHPPLTSSEMSSSFLELKDHVEVDCYEEYIDCFDDESDEDDGYQPYGGNVDDYYSDDGDYDPIFDTVVDALYFQY